MLESELFALLERTNDAAFAVTPQGEILSWNKRAEKLLGYQANEVLHKTCFDVLEGVDPLGTHVCHQHASVLDCAGGKTDIPNFDMSVKKKSGDRLWINMSTLIFDNPRNGQRLLLHLAHDITEQKRAENLVRTMLEVSKQLTVAGETSVRAAPISPLSEQEIQILRMFADGKDSDGVARALEISPQTLRNHLHHINQKLRTRNRLEAVMNAMQRKLI